MRRPSLSLLLLLVLSSCTTVNLTPGGEQAAAPAATPSATKARSASQAPAAKSPFKPWAEVLKDTRAIDGFFRTHLKRDQTLYLELRPDQLDQDFGMVMHYSQGVGVFNVHDGLPLSAMQLMRFRRVGDKIYLVHVNPRFTADPGSPMRTSLDDNVGHSVVAAFKIATEDTTSRAVVIDAGPLFVSDYAQISDQLRFYYGNKPVMFDKSRSHVAGVMGFPKNVEIDASLTYKANNWPRFGGVGVSDYRSIPIGVRYSLVALPEEPMQPRLADDRVGHFLDAVRDFSRDREVTPYVRYVNRWRLEKKDPYAEVSEPVRPIVFYIDRSVPLAYRPYVKEGIEAWNEAFEAAGFRQAIRAVEAPDDPAWSAEDARYSTVRWTAAHQMGYAIGPSQTDPRTGEILNADILISSTFVTGWNNEYQELVGPDGLLERFRQAQDLQRRLPAPLADRMCLAEMGKAHQLGFQQAALAALGRISGVEPMPEEYLGNALRDLVMHEVGHTLGLRHNFKGSSAISIDRLNDQTFTREHGLTLSVMDYAATNIAVDPERQGDYVNMGVGTYDRWAIQYAYQPILVEDDGGTNGDKRLAATPDEEREALRKIAEQAADPFHAYNTDEDTHRGPMAVDPLSNTWDLGSDPLRYARERGALVDRIAPVIEARLIADGDGYQRLRGAVSGLLFERYIALLPVTKNVGGLYFTRDHKNDPDGRMPFTPVTAQRQREAVQLIVDQAFAEGALAVDGALLNKMPPNRYADWANTSWAGAIDVPIHDFVGSLQASLLAQLLDNGRLARMVDNTVRMPAGAEAYTVAELFETLTDAIWAEVLAERPRNAGSFRRNLQRAYLDEMTRIMLDLRPYPWIRSTPEDARSLARLELARLSDRLDAVLAAPAGLDRTSRAHLLESQARIDRALEASLSRPLK